MEPIDAYLLIQISYQRALSVACHRAAAAERYGRQSSQFEVAQLLHEETAADFADAVIDLRPELGDMFDDAWDLVEQVKRKEVEEWAPRWMEQGEWAELGLPAP
jgi:hypothetical protein